MKKTASIFLAAMLACGVVLSLCGCDDKDKKYDVTMKIRCKTKNEYGSVITEEEEWIFTPDVSELHTEREYDGLEHTYYLDTFNLPDHPRWSDTWFTPQGEGANVFGGTRDYLYYDIEGNQSVVKSVHERGEYIFHPYAASTSDLWNFRSVYLYITIV